MKNNYDSYFFKIIQEICLKKKIEIEIMSSEFRILKLKKNRKEHVVYGSDFGLNDSASIQIVNNKYATFEILNQSGIPVINTYLFDLENKPQKKELILFQLENLLKTHKTLILKPNKGFQGIDVFKIENLNEINNKIKFFCNKNVSFIAQPFEKIEYEIRVICINNEPRLYYKKTIKDINLGWKHNLSKNIQVNKFFTNSEFNKINSIINNVLRKIPCKNCSIDIIKTFENKYKVLEINGNPALVNYSKISDQARNEVKNIYSTIISELF